MSTTKKNPEHDDGSKPSLTCNLACSSAAFNTQSNASDRISALLPLELIAATFFIVSLLIITIFKVPFYFPSQQSTAFALNHYLAGFVLASVIVLAFSFIGVKISIESACAGLIEVLRNATALGVIVFLHFNFKLWAQLVNPYLFDDWYKWTDELIHPLREAFVFLNHGFFWLKDMLPGAYHDVFIFMFFTSFAFFGISPTARPHLGRLAATVALVLTIGGLSYTIAPAWGPFIFSSNPSDIQKIMSAFQTSFISSGGTAYSGHDFISPLAAMPSLHTAHAFVLWFYARKHLRWLGYIYLPFVIFIFTEAVVSEWHYLIDLPFGLLIAYFSIMLSGKLHQNTPSVNAASCSNAIFRNPAS